MAVTKGVYNQKVCSDIACSYTGMDFLSADIDWLDSSQRIKSLTNIIISSSGVAES